MAAHEVLLGIEREEAGAADHPPMGKLGPQYEPLLIEFLKDPLVRYEFNTVPTDIAMVELDRLVVYQKHIDVTFARKLEEAMYAIWLERRFTKDEILELYLNRVYFGGGTYGVEAAARRYFGRSARSVTLTQAALLAGLLKAPSRYAPTRDIELASTRIDVVLDNMVDAGFLTTAEASAAAAQPLRLRNFGDETGFPYAVDWVAETLPDVVGNNQGDLIVETTIDAGLQRATQTTLRETLEADRARAERALQAELRRQAADRTLMQLKLIAMFAGGLLLMSGALVAWIPGMRDGVGAAVLGGGWAAALAALGCMFAAWPSVSRWADGTSPEVQHSGMTMAPWLLLVALALCGASVLIA